MLLKNKCNFLDKWCAFLAKKLEEGKLLAVSKDVWESLWDFIDASGGDLSKAEDDGCWPVLIEEFC